MTTPHLKKETQVSGLRSAGEFGLGLTQLVGIPATALALGVGGFVGNFYGTMWAQPAINIPVAFSEITAIDGPVAVAAIAGLGLATLINLRPQHFVELGGAIKDFGKNLLDKTAELGQSLGLLAPGETAIQKVIENSDEPGANWKRLAAHSTMLMMAPILTSSILMTAGAGINALSKGEYIPYAIGAAATAAASAFAVYKSYTATKGMENGTIGQTLEDLTNPRPKKKSPTNQDISLG